MHCKHNINTKSSNKAEVVGIGNVMPQIMWIQYFLEAQGMTWNETIVYEDNQSTIRMEVNGNSSSGKETFNINVKYFFVKDRIKSGDIYIHNFP